MCRGVTCKGSSKIAHGNSTGKSTKCQRFHRTQPEYTNLHQWTEYTYCSAYVLLKISRLIYLTGRTIWKLVSMCRIQRTLRPAASSLGPKQSNRFGYRIERWTKQSLVTALHIWYWPRLCITETGDNPISIKKRLVSRDKNERGSKQLPFQTNHLLFDRRDRRQLIPVPFERLTSPKLAQTHGGLFLPQEPIYSITFS